MMSSCDGIRWMCPSSSAFGLVQAEESYLQLLQSLLVIELSHFPLSESVPLKAGGVIYTHCFVR